jgi:GT2 family glycosyltransferase
MIENVFVFDPIRPDFIERCLLTLKKYTHHDYRIVLIDQTMDGMYEKVKNDVHLYLRPYRNLGFSKSMNEGIIHGIRWGAKYITVINDDIVFMDDRWWDGIMETMNSDPNIMGVNPECPKEPGWGYGLPDGEFINLMEYKENFTTQDYDYLLEGDFSGVAGLPDTFPRKKVGVIDAIATWCTTFRRECFEQYGLFDERYYPGGGEDYDYNARIYRTGKRLVGTTKSWVYHFWGASKDKLSEHKGKSLPLDPALVWNHPHLLWPEDKNGGQVMDPWGKWTDKDGNKIPMERDPVIGIIDI